MSTHLLCSWKWITTSVANRDVFSIVSNAGSTLHYMSIACTTVWAMVKGRWDGQCMSDKQSLAQVTGYLCLL
jgi:hypothetical protein